MAKKKYELYSREQLLEKIKQLEKHRYGLVWEDKLEDVAEQCDQFLPVLHEETSNEIFFNEELPNNILIEGDNYHALYTLNFTHKRKVDVIYIDPPYNTGNQTWVYNNRYVDNNDRFKHSKWLSFMSKRLKLAKNLLKDDGFFIAAIDFNELFPFGLLLDEIFGERNRLGIVTVVHKPEGRNQEKFFGTSNEFMLVYAKNIDRAKFNKVVIDEELQIRFEEDDEKGKFRLKNFIRLTDGKYSIRENKPHFFYPIFVSSDLKKFSLTKKKNFKEVLPITGKGIERTWKTTKDTFLKLANAGDIVAKKENNLIILYEKLRENQVIKTHWIKKEYHAYHYGTKLLESILGAKKFDFPKSVYLVLDILKITSKENSIILDFFAGSGTTGHAVLELNQQDGGNRQFILCTNNENKICEEVTLPRIEKVIIGYNGNKGIPANLKYFKTVFVPQVITDNDKRVLVNRSTELLCIGENTFELVKQSKRKLEFAIYKNNKQLTAIIYDEDAIEKCKEELQAMKPKVKTVVYIFSYGHEYNAEDFEDLNIRFDVKPIPEAILNVYRKNAKLKRK